MNVRDRAKTYTVNERADVLVDLHIGTSRELVAGREPGGERRVREDVPVFSSVFRSVVV